MTRRRAALARHVAAGLAALALGGAAVIGVAIHAEAAPPRHAMAIFIVGMAGARLMMAGCAALGRTLGGALL